MPYGFGLGLVADALDLERLLVPLRHALDHVGDQRARQAVQRLVPRLVARARHGERAAVERRAACRDAACATASPWVP